MNPYYWVVDDSFVRSPRRCPFHNVKFSQYHVSRLVGFNHALKWTIYHKKLDNLTLSKVPRWTAGDSWRKSNVDEAEDEPDLLEVETEEFEQPEGDWEMEEDEDGEVLLIRSVEESDGF